MKAGNKQVLITQLPATPFHGTRKILRYLAPSSSQHYARPSFSGVHRSSRRLIHASRRHWTKSAQRKCSFATSREQIPEVDDQLQRRSPASGAAGRRWGGAGQRPRHLVARHPSFLPDSRIARRDRSPLPVEQPRQHAVVSPGLRALFSRRVQRAAGQPSPTSPAHGTGSRGRPAPANPRRSRR